MRAIALIIIHSRGNKSIYVAPALNLLSNELRPGAVGAMFIAAPANHLREFAARERIVDPVDAVVIKGHFITNRARV